MAPRAWGAGFAAVAALFASCAPAAAVDFPAACSGTMGDPASLVAAIAAANDTSAGPDTVRLGAGCTYTLSSANNNWYGPNGLPAIASDITIEGNGSAIARAATAPKFRLFFVGADASSPNTDSYVSPGPGKLTLRDVTLTGGLANGGDSHGGGGGAGMGGAIFSQGVVVIERSTLSGNTAQGGSGINMSAGADGAGIGTDAQVSGGGGGFGSGTFAGGGGGNANGSHGGGGAGFRVTESGNAATTTGGIGGGTANGMGGFGGGDGVNAGDGSGGGGTGGGMGSGGRGGDFGAGGSDGSMGGGTGPGGGGGGVGGGGAGGGGGSGGGGFGGGGGRGCGGCSGGTGGFGGGGGSASTAGGPGFGGTTGSNTSTAGGGGAGMGGAIFTMQGQLTVRDSTIAGNAAVGGTGNSTAMGLGGGVFNLNGSFNAIGSTLAINRAANGGASIYNLDYDAAKARTAQTTLVDTIVAGGVGPVDLTTAKPASTTGVLTNLGTSAADLTQLDLVRTSQADGGTISGSPLTSDPSLGALQDNGGPTATMAPQADSPVVDAGVASGLTTDQRGDPRPVDFPGVANAMGGDGSDIGAFELQSSCAGQPSPLVACHTLTVSLAGTGAGTVGGSGIACPGSCSGSYPSGTSVTLTPQAAAGSTFVGWSGACAGTGACVVTVDAERAVTATFNAKPSCSLKARSARVLTGGRLKLTARCNQAAQVLLAGRVKRARHKRTKAKTFRLRTVTASLTPGKARTLTVKLPKAALAGLKAGARESAGFTLTAANANGKVKATARIARLKPPKRK